MDDRKDLMNRALDYLRRNTIAGVALACSLLSLAGASYAALSLPAGSVGAAQIRNHVIDPVKLNPQTIAGSIRASVVVQWGAGGKLVARASSSPVRITTGSTGEGLIWPHRHFSRRCVASATPQVNLNPGIHPNGYVTAQFDPANPPGAFLELFGFAPDGSRSAQAADVLIACP
jgi:hypothetical protein